MNKVVLFLNKEPLGGMTKEEFIEKLKGALKNRVDECYIFGSFYTDKFSPNSDVDIILIKNTQESFLNRGKEFLDLYEIGSKIDLLVYTPEEFARLLEEPAGFWKSVKETLVKIF